ncbi:MAG: GNAT family N-acetyltransferase [Pseudomonadota bacterium]
MVRLRAGVPDDGTALLALHHASILSLGQGFYSAEELEDWASGLTPGGYGRAMKEEDFLVAEAVTDQALAGFTSFKDDEVVGFYVHPDWARCGLGSLLLERAEAAIAAGGHTTIRIEASLSGLPFYEARGYRNVRRRPYRTRGGLQVDIVELTKAL